MTESSHNTTYQNSFDVLPLSYSLPPVCSTCLDNKETMQNNQVKNRDHLI